MLDTIEVTLWAIPKSPKLYHFIGFLIFEVLTYVLWIPFTPEVPTCVVTSNHATRDETLETFDGHGMLWLPLFHSSFVDFDLIFLLILWGSEDYVVQLFFFARISPHYLYILEDHIKLSYLASNRSETHTLSCLP